MNDDLELVEMKCKFCEGPLVLDRTRETPQFKFYRCGSMSQKVCSTSSQTIYVARAKPPMPLNKFKCSIFFRRTPPACKKGRTMACKLLIFRFYHAAAHALHALGGWLTVSARMPALLK